MSCSLFSDIVWLFTELLTLTSSSTLLSCTSVVLFIGQRLTCFLRKVTLTSSFFALGTVFARLGAPVFFRPTIK